MKLKLNVFDLQINLRKCPFCEGIHIYIDNDADMHDGSWIGYYIECNSCGVKGPVVFKYRNQIALGEYLARLAWNNFNTYISNYKKL